MPVSSKHPDYIKFEKRWEKCRKLMDSDAHSYIEDIEPSNQKRSEKYRDDAILTNFTARTINGLVGLVFAKPPTFELPPGIEYLKEDCTDDNLSLEQASKEAFEETLTTGRCGIMSDYPAVDRNINKRDLDKLDLKARLYIYQAEEIINWTETIVAGRKITTMVHIKEEFDQIDPDDGFRWVKGVRFINLRLINGVYVLSYYNHKEDLVAQYIPKKANGQPFRELPFAFIGSRKNKPKPDSPPLYDIACINIGHLKDSAAQQESIVVTGQPSLFITTSLSADDFKVANPNGIKIGARAGHNLGESGSAIMLQAQPNTLAAEGMKEKERQAFMVGAQLLQPQASNETAAAARIRNSSELSVLDSIATNTSEGIRKGIRWSAEFMGADPNAVTFDLNYDFVDENESPQSIMAQIQLLDRGAIAMTDLRRNLKKVDLLVDTRKDEDIDNEILERNPLQ